MTTYLLHGNEARAQLEEVVRCVFLLVVCFGFEFWWGCVSRVSMEAEGCQSNDCFSAKNQAQKLTATQPS